MKCFTLIGAILLAIISQSASAAFEIPAYQSFTMKNGLKVYLMQQSEVPLIDIRLSIRAGAIDDQNRLGLANLTSQSLLLGSGDLSKTEVEDILAFHGANLSSSSSSEMSTLSLSMAAKDQSTLLPLFRNIALNPRFNQTEFDKLKTRYLSQLKQNKESPKNIINDIFAKMYYNDHPYANPVSGDTHHIDKIALKQIKGFYNQFYTPMNSALVIVGDFQPEMIKKQITQLFENWTGNAPKPKNLPAVAAKKAPKVLILNKDDAIETTFIIGGKGLKANHPDYVPSQVLNTILGGRFTSWLNSELRINSGLTYGAGSGFRSQSKAGHFIISTFTKKETTFAAIDLTLKTYQRLWKQGVDKATLESAKAYVKGQFPPRYETSSQLASLLSRIWALNLNDTIINEFEGKVDNLDLNKANQLAKQLFPIDNLQFVLIGKASEIKQQAEQYGEVTVIDVNDYRF